MVHGSGHQRRLGNPYSQVRRRKRKKIKSDSKLTSNGLKSTSSQGEQDSSGESRLMFGTRGLERLWQFAINWTGEDMDRKKEEQQKCSKKKLASAFIGTLAALGVVLVSVFMFIEPREELHTRTKRYAPSRENRYRTLSTPIKVLIVSDDEESATLIADVLDQDTRAFYLYEPIWGFYQSMGYGEAALRYPWDINVNFDGSLRKPPSYEIGLEREVMKAIMNCNTDNISVEILLNKFLFQKDDYSLRTVRHVSLEDFGYLSCIIDEFRGQDQVNSQLRNCKSPIEAFCPGFQYEGVDVNCYKVINMYKGAHQVSKQVLDRVAQKPDNYLRFFMDHQLCLNDLKPKVGACMQKFTQACSTADLLAVVSMRMNLDAIHEVLKGVPDLKVVHITRDPRDTLAFARANHFQERSMDVSREAGRLCNKMWSDIQNLSALKSINDTMMQLKYEDIVGDPRQSMHDLRVFLGLETQSSLPSVVRSLFSMGDTEYSRTVDRHQDQRNVGVWQRMFSQTEIQMMNLVCSSTIHTLGY